MSRESQFFAGRKRGLEAKKQCCARCRVVVEPHPRSVSRSGRSRSSSLGFSIFSGIKEGAPGATIGVGHPKLSVPRTATVIALADAWEELQHKKGRYFSSTPSGQRLPLARR